MAYSEVEDPEVCSGGHINKRSSFFYDWGQNIVAGMDEVHTTTKGTLSPGTNELVPAVTNNTLAGVDHGGNRDREV